jgi:hypothetical protein
MNLLVFMQGMMAPNRRDRAIQAVTAVNNGFKASPWALIASKSGLMPRILMISV